MKKLSQAFVDFAKIAFAMAIASAAVYFFLIPSELSIGSVSGLSLVVSKLVPLPVSTITFIINMSLLILGFILVGGEFCKRTVIASILLPVYLGVLERFFPNQGSLTGDQFLDMLGYIFVVSIGMAMLFHWNASSGGLDIVAKILNKFFRMDLGQAGALIGLVAACSSLLVYESKAVFLSFLGTYVQGIVVDHFIFGIRVKKRVCILSEKDEEIRQFILHELHSGATIYEATGAYDFKPHREIIAIVDKGEYAKLMNYVSKADPNAFVTVYAVSEVLYRPKNLHK